MKLYASVIAIILFSNSAFSQENTCVDLAKVVGVNYSRYLDKDEQRSVSKADMCSASYNSASSSTKAQIEAGYLAFSGTASKESSQLQVAQNEICEGKFGDFWRNQIKTGEARLISSEGAAVINTCLNLNTQSLYPNLTMQADGQEFAVSVQYRPTVNSTISVSQFGPVDLTKNDCSVTNGNQFIKASKAADISQTLSPTQSIFMSCKRQLELVKIKDAEYKCSPEVLFAIATSGPVNALKIPRVCTEEIKPARLEALEKDVISKAQELDKVASLVDTLLKEIDKLKATTYTIQVQPDAERRGSFVDWQETSFACSQAYTSAGVVTGIAHGKGKNDTWFYCGNIILNKVSPP